MFKNCIFRKKDNNTYQGTTWQIKFTLDTVDQIGTYKLRVAIASATLSELQVQNSMILFFSIFYVNSHLKGLMFFIYKVRVNDPKANPPHFTSGLIGRDNTIARHGIHGLYWLYSVNVLGNLLVEGENTIFLTQPRSTSPFQGILYDYIRLEAPPSPNSNSNKKLA